MLSSLILESLFFLLPAAVATLIAQMLGHWKLFEFLNIPVDFGKTLGGKRIFGDHKTIRGFIFGTVSGGLIAVLQYFVAPYTQAFINPEIFGYVTLLSSFVLGLLLGFGAMLGDMAKSFFKRQLNIASGKPWPFFDQIDYPLGACFASLCLTNIGMRHFMASIILYSTLHVITTTIGYFLGVKKTMLG